MSPSSPPLGCLHLIPTPLDFGCGAADTLAPIAELLPGETLRTAASLQHWITENARSTRAFLKRVDAVHPLCAPLQAMQISELPRAVHKKGDHSGPPHAAIAALLAPALQGHDMGLVSEAGMPAVADPGSSVVQAAHRLGIRVCPHSGPVSLMMALAAAGFNGQQFAFVGYLPQEAAARQQRIRQLEQQAQRQGHTQIFIETPYRNAALLQALLEHLKPETRLAVALGLSLPSQQVRSARVADWKRQPMALPWELPAVFVLHAGD